MNDREFLELAAKAAGYAVDCGFEDCPLIFGEASGPDGPREWNPLADDGDALRLAHALGMQLYLDECNDINDVRTDIVMAAAAIGQSMTDGSE